MSGILTEKEWALIPFILAVLLFYYWTTYSNGPYPYSESRLFYPQLGRAFVEGHTYLGVVPRPELLALSNPYDPDANEKFRLHDASLFQGKYYIYFGPAPAVVLFAPFYAVTGQDFPQSYAVTLFCSVGFLASIVLFLMLVRNHLPQAPLWGLIGVVLTLGLANTIPFLLRRPDVYEASISCAYCFLQLSFLFLYLALRRPSNRVWWLGLVSLCLGCAVGARLNYVLIVPLFAGMVLWLEWQRFNSWRSAVRALLVALLPLFLIGLTLALYNYARFGNFLENGQRYQLAGINVTTLQFMRGDNFPRNLYYYFISIPSLGRTFPFIWAMPKYLIPEPDRFYGLENVVGIFLIAPVSLLALRSPFVVRRQFVKESSLAILLLFIGGCTMATLLSILCASGATMRYFVDFAPGLIFLGCVIICHDLVNFSGHGIVRLAQSFISVLIISIGVSTGVLLSFTGYYDFLKMGSPQSYAQVQQIFRPMEQVGSWVSHVRKALFPSKE